MAAKKNQHWVPKFYLNAFAIPETRNDREPQVYALSKWERDNAREIRIGTKNVAASSYLYSPVNEAGLRDYTFEDKQASLESLLATLWRLLAEGNVPLVEGYRKALALFAANLYLRHPRQRILSRNRLEQIQNAFETHLSGCDEIETELLVDGRTVTTTITREDFEAFRARTDNDYHRHFVEHVNDTTVVIAKLLMAKRWNVIVSPSANFVTSDNPVSFMGPSGRSFGFGTPGTSVYLPLTPEKLLTISDTAPRENTYVEIRQMPGFVGPPESAFNFETYSNSYRFVFGPKSLWPVLENGIKHCENLIFSDPNSHYYKLRTPDGRRIRHPRNAPCHCGSGRKYKNCHFRLERMLELDADKLRSVARERHDLTIEDNEIG